MSLSLNHNLLAEFTYNNIFVETGTYTGGGVQVALDCGFREIRSIEIDHQLYELIRDRFKNENSVKLFYGDSSTEDFWNMIKDIEEPATFLLDAHLSSGDPLAHPIEVPLLKELDIIKRHKIKTHTILIDDVRIFGYNPSADPRISKEWGDITRDRVISSVLGINNKYTISYRNTNNAQNDLLVANV